MRWGDSERNQADRKSRTQEHNITRIILIIVNTCHADERHLKARWGQASSADVTKILSETNALETSNVARFE